MFALTMLVGQVRPFYSIWQDQQTSLVAAKICQVR